MELKHDAWGETILDMSDGSRTPEVLARLAGFIGLMKSQADANSQAMLREFEGDPQLGANSYRSLFGPELAEISRRVDRMRLIVARTDTAWRAERARRDNEEISSLPTEPLLREDD